MAKQGKGILGGFNGKLGTVVGYDKYGKAIIARPGGLEKGQTPPQLEKTYHPLKVYNAYFKTLPESIQLKYFPEGYNQWQHVHFLMRENRLRGLVNDTNIDYQSFVKNIRDQGTDHFEMRSALFGGFCQTLFGAYDNNSFGDTHAFVIATVVDQVGNFHNVGDEVRSIDFLGQEFFQNDTVPRGDYLAINLVRGQQSGIVYNSAMILVFNPG